MLRCFLEAGWRPDMPIDFTQFFNPAAHSFGSWAPPARGILAPQVAGSPTAPLPAGNIWGRPGGGMGLPPGGGAAMPAPGLGGGGMQLPPGGGAAMPAPGLGGGGMQLPP